MKAIISASRAFAMLVPALAEPLPVQKPPGPGGSSCPRSACHFAAHKTRSPSRQPGAVPSAGRRRVPFVCRASGRCRAARPVG